MLSKQELDDLILGIIPEFSDCITKSTIILKWGSLYYEQYKEVVIGDISKK